MQFRIDADHPCLPGHFPDQPLVPGVLIVDRVLAALEARHGAIGAVRMSQVKFLQPLRPGQTACVVLEGDVPRWRFRVLRDDAVLASGDLVLA